MASYKVLVGLNYPPDRRVEPGEVADDIPGKSIKWLLEQGCIEPVGGKVDEPVALLDEEV